MCGEFISNNVDKIAFIISCFFIILVAFSSRLKHAKFTTFMRNLFSTLFWMYWL